MGGGLLCGDVERLELRAQGRAVHPQHLLDVSGAEREERAHPGQVHRLRSSGQALLRAFFLVPETKGLSLERMDELFGMTDFSGIQDIGVASKSAKGDVEAIHVEAK